MNASTYRQVRALYRLIRLVAILGPQGTALFLAIAGKEATIVMIKR